MSRADARRKPARTGFGRPLQYRSSIECAVTPIAGEQVVAARAGQQHFHAVLRAPAG